MKNYILRFLSFIFALILIFQIPITEIYALDFVAGENPASDSYKSGMYYENLTSVQLTGDGRTDVLAVALSQLGYQEGPSEGQFSGLVSGSSNFTEFNYNFGDFGSGYGGDYAWCAAFVSFCLLQAKTHSYTKMADWCRAHMGDKNYIWREISCTHWANQLRQCGYFRDSKSNGGSYQPQSGDLIFFADGGVGASETHIGLVLYSDSEKVYTVEGNTSSADGLEANGGGVYLKSYALDRTYIRGYGVLPYKVNSSVPEIDYSGNNITTGMYAASTNKYVYETENSTEYKWLLPRGTMFTVTEICSNGRVKATCKIDGETVTGYIMNNSDRIVQLSSDEEYITHIEVTKLPDKLNYYVGDSFEKEGMVVTAYYSTGKTEEVTDYTVSGYTATEGTKTITVTKGDFKTSFEVVVERDTLTKIELTSMPSKTVYFVGEEFDATGMVITAIYEDGSTKVVSDYTVNGYSGAAGYKRITVKYGNKSVSFMITVKENVIEKTELSSLPYKLEYAEGEVISLDGLVLSAVYSDGTRKEITDYTVKGTELKAGKNIITVEYSGFEVSFEIIVRENEPADETTTAPTTEAPTTEVPTTEIPATEAPTTEAPTTEAPTTEAPTTEAPTTETPTTEAPTTEAPTTEAPTTEAPTTEAPTEPSTVPSTTVHSHTVVVLPAREATYKTTGLTEGKMCSQCKEIIVAQKKVARKKLKKVTSLEKKAVTLEKGTKSTLTLSWKKVTGAEKYEIYQYINKKWKKIKTTSKASYKVTKLTANKEYKFKVRAVAGTNKGSFSSVLTTKTVPLKPTVTVKTGKRQLTASWKKVENITGYEVQYSTSKKFTKKTTKTLTAKSKTTSKKVSGLKAKKTYYVRIRTYKTVKGKRVCSAWSSVKSVKTK